MKPATVERASRVTVAGRSAAERKVIGTRRFQVSKLYESGMTISEIALELGCSRSRIGDDVQKLGLSRPRGRVPGTRLSRESCEKISAAKKGKPRLDVSQMLTAIHADREQHAQRMLRAIKGRKRHNVKPNTIRAWNLRTIKSPGRPPKYHPETRGEVRKLRAEGRSWNEIAGDLGIPRDTARSMAAGR